MEGANKNLSKSDIAALDSLEQQLFAVKTENGLEGLNKASKAGVLLLQNPKLEQYAQIKGNPLQFKAKVKKQINQLQQQIQQAQLDKTNNNNQPDSQDIAGPVAVASAPAAAAQAVRQPEDTRIQNEDDAFEEAMRVRELANGNDGKASRDDYQTASDLLDEEKREKAAKQAEAEKLRPGEPRSRLSQDEAMDMAAKNGGSNAIPPGQSHEQAAQKIKRQTAPATKDKPAGETAKKPQVPGGDAVKPKSRIGQAIQGARNLRSAGDQLAKKAGGKLAATAASAAGLGALAGIADKIGQWTTDKLLPFFKKYKFWLMTPTFMIVLLLGSTSMGIAGALMQRDGRNGGTIAEYGDVNDPTFVTSVSELVGQSYMIPGDPRSWYFSQADPKFNTERLKGHWGQCSPYLKCAGCAITSSTMIARYYGVKDIDPTDYASRITGGNNSGSLSLNKDLIAAYVNEKWEADGISRRKQNHMTRVTKNVDSVRKAIQHGDPLLVKGYQAFGFGKIPNSGSQHWVVIVGISLDGKYLIISDPAGTGWSGRGSAARPISVNQLSNGQILELWVLQDAK